MTSVRAFLPSEMVVAAGLAVIIEAMLAILLVTATNHTRIRAKEEVAAEPEPIEVKPVLDDVPLLKLGSKKMKAKLPDMWTKKPPIKKLYEAASAPSPKAPPVLEKIPDTPLVKPSATPPPPDAAIAKKVDPYEKPPEKEEPSPQLAEEGSEQGIKEGTEKDPMKAFAVGQYRMKLASWFNSHFKISGEQIPCDELKKLRAGVSASVSGSRTIASYSITKSSGNEVFDGRVKAAMDGIVGGGLELPPPPPNYPDILQSTIAVGFSRPSCD